MSFLNCDCSIDFFHFSLICDEDILKNRISNRFKEREIELGISYSDFDIQEMLLGALEKKSFYLVNDAIKLDGNNDVETLYREIIENIKLKEKSLKKLK